MEFKLHGHDVLFIAGPPFVTSLSLGDRICAICNFDDEGRAVVVDMLHRGNNETIPEEAKKALLKRLGGKFVGLPENN